jgi:hypothetical protein
MSVKDVLGTIQTVSTKPKLSTPNERGTHNELICKNAAHRRQNR